MEMAKPRAVLCQKRGAVVSLLVPKLKEAVPPPPPLGLPRSCGYHNHLTTKKRGLCQVIKSFHSVKPVLRCRPISETFAH